MNVCSCQAKLATADEPHEIKQLKKFAKQSIPEVCQVSGSAVLYLSDEFAPVFPAGLRIFHMPWLYSLRPR